MSKGIGIYIGRNEVIAVSAVHSIKGPQIKSYAIEPINPEGQEPAVGKEAHKLKKLSAEAKAIRKALEKIKEPGAYVTAAVSPAEVVTRHFIMPAVPKKEEANAVRFEANRYIPFKSSESVMSYDAYASHKNVLAVTATALKKEILQQALNDLRAASCKVLMVEPAYVAAGRAFASANLSLKAKTCGFVIMQSDGSVNLTFASKGVVYLSRDFLLTGTVEEDKKRFFEELKASLDYFYKLTGGEAAQQVFITGHGDLKSWVEYLEQAFNYTVRFDLAKLPGETNIQPDVLSSIFVAYGLAIWALGYKSAIGEVELLPAMERRSKPQKFFSILAGEVLGIALVFLLIRLVIFQPYVAGLQNQNNKIFGPESGVDPVIAQRSLAELSTEHAAISAQLGILEGFMQSRISAKDLFSSLGQGLPKAITMDYVSVEDTGGGAKGGKGTKRMNLRGFCFMGNAEREATTVNTWVQTLAVKKIVADMFTETKLEKINRERRLDRDATSFKVLCE